MDEQYIQDLYNQLGGKQEFGEFNDFKNLIQNDSSYQKDFHNAFGEDVLGSFQDFSSLVGKAPSVVSEPVKKKDTTEFLSEDGSLESPIFKGLTPKQAADLEAKGKEQSYMGKVVPKPYKIDQQTLKENIEFENQFKKLGSQQEFEKSLEGIDKELIDKDESYIAPQLTQEFGGYGFKFEEALPGQEAIEVTAPNGKKKTIPVDTFFESKDIQSSIELKNFINENKPRFAKITDEYSQYIKRFKNQEEIDNSLKEINSKEEEINSQQKELALIKAQVESEPSHPDYAQRKQEILNKEQELLQREKTTAFNKRQLDRSIGRYTDMKAQQGNFGSAVEKTLYDGIAGMSATVVDVANTIATRIVPLEYQMGKDAYREEFIKYAKTFGINAPENLNNEQFKNWQETVNDDTRDFIDEKIIDDNRKGLKKEVTKPVREGMPKLLGDKSLSKEYMEKLNENEIARNFLGVVGMAPTIASGMVAGEAATPFVMSQFFGMAYNSAMEEMDNSAEFKDISEGEKFKVASVLGITNAVIAEYGLSKIVGGKNIGNEIAVSALRKAGMKTNAETFKNLVENEIKNRIARGVLTTAAATPTGALVGAELKATELGIKEIYNLSNSKKMFNTPDSFTGYVEEIGQSAKDMAIGSAMMAIPNALITAYKSNNYNGVSDKTVEAYETLAKDDIYRRGFVIDLKNKVNSGEITAEQAKAQIDDLNKNASLFNSLPDGLSPEQKRQALSLLAERSKLTDAIDGKDASLVKKQKDRITEINDLLTKISEENAIQEPSTEEGVLRTKQPELELPKMGEGDQAEKPSEPLTQEEQQRKTELEQALEQPENETGTVTIGEQEFKREEIKNELDALKEREVSSKTLSELEQVQKRIDEIETTLTDEAVGGIVLEPEQKVSLEEELSSLKVRQEALSIEENLGEEPIAKPTQDESIPVTNVESLNEIVNKTEDLSKLKVLESARRLVKTLQSILPKFDIHIHENEGSYNAVMKDVEGIQGSAGNFSYKRNEDGSYEGRVDINLSRAKYNTVAHEVAHGVLLKFFGDNQTLFKTFQERLAKVLSDSTNEKLLEFANNPEYVRQGVTYEEYMAELKSALSEQGVQLNLSTAKKIAALINEFVSKITNGKFKPFQKITDVKQVVDFVNDVSRSMAKGEAIDVESINNIGVSGKIEVGESVRSKASIVSGEIKRFETNKNTKVEEDVRLSIFNGKVVNLMESDRMTAGFISDKNNKPLFYFYGGVLYPAVTGKWWASRNIKTAKKIVENANKNRDVDGYIYSAPMVGAPSQHMSNNDMLLSTIKLMESDVNRKKGGVKKNDFIDKLKQAFSRKDILSKKDILTHILENNTKTADIFNALETVLTDIKNDNIVDVNGIEILGKDGKPIKALTFEQRLSVVETLLGNKKVKEHMFPSAGSFEDVAKRFEEPLTSKAKKVGDIVTLMRTKGTLKFRQTEKSDEFFHKSYPVEIFAVDENGNPAEIELYILDGAYSMRDVFPKLIKSSGGEFTWDEYYKKHGKKSDVSAEAQYNRTARLSSASGKVASEVKEMEKSFPLSKSQVDARKSIEDIVKQARAQGFSEDGIREFLKKKGIQEGEIDTLMKPEKAAARVEITEETLPGFDRMMREAEGIVAEKKRGRKESEMYDAVMSYVMGSKAYTDATDVQREQLVRQVRERFDLKEKKAPGINKILGQIKDVVKITMTEKAALAKQIRDYARGARDVASVIRNATDVLSKEVKELTRNGSITTTQAANVVRMFGKTNVLSETSVKRFTDYMSKVFADAEYANKLKEGNTLKRDISRMSKDAEKNANLTDLGKEFSRIDPSMVDNIEQYNEMASLIKESLKGSTIKEQNVNFAEMVNIAKAMEYIGKTLEVQEAKLEEEMRSEIQDLMGIDASKLSADDMIALLDNKKPITSYNKGIIRSTINKAFNIYSSVIKSMLRTGKDAITGEDVKFSDSDRTIINKFMNMDLSLMGARESLKAVDALTNFIQNGSTAKMATVIAENMAEVNGKYLVDNNIVARKLSKYGSDAFERFLAETLNTLPIVFEKMFPGVRKSTMVMDKIGLNTLINKTAYARTKSNNIVNDYVKNFYTKEANGQEFNTTYNNIERGMSAFMLRTVIGSEKQMAVEFKRRKTLIEESIDALSQGNEKEVAMSKMYKDAYDKILKDSKNIEDVRKKTDKTNLDAVEFWQKKWAENYEQMADVSKQVYNVVLNKNLNYTPDRFSKISTNTEKVDLADDASSFHFNNGVILKPKTGSLMEVSSPENLPKENGEVLSFIDLSFDKNMSNSMHDALIDVNTAQAVRQVNAFVNSKNFKKVIPSAEDALLIKGSKNHPGLIQLYIEDVRNKSYYSNDELSQTLRRINKISSFGVGQALAGVFQPIKQVVPVAINTFANAGFYDLAASFNIDKYNFIKNSGHSIANRGIESQAEVESLNTMIEDAASSRGAKAFQKIEQANKAMLKYLLAKPDAFIARASWLAYYEKSLKEQGVDTKNLNYKTHELNEQAANFATKMVDRQQNISDHSLAGSLFKSKDVSRQVLVKMLMSFASFRMNQAARLSADIIALRDKTTSAEDRTTAKRSLAGFASEVATFKVLSAAISLLTGSAALAMMGKDESEEEYEKRKKNIIKGQMTGTVTDILSPIPVADPLVQFLTKPLMDVGENITGLPLSIYDVNKEQFLKKYGTFGISAERLGTLYEVGHLAATGEYTDDFGNVKKINEQDRETLKSFILPSVMVSIGLAPSEVNSVVKNVVKFAKTKVKTDEEKRLEEKAKEEKAISKENKLNELREIIKNTDSEIVKDAAFEKIDEIIADKEQKQAIKEENKLEREKKKELLVDPETGETYDNETEMKRYNRDLWEENFGEDSDWAKEHKEEREANKELREKLREIEDDEYGYTPKKKKGEGLFGKKKKDGGGLFSKKKKKVGLWS